MSSLHPVLSEVNGVFGVFGWLGPTLAVLRVHINTRVSIAVEGNITQ